MHSSNLSQIALPIKWLLVQIFSFKNHAESEAGRLVPDFFLFFEKALDVVKRTGL